MHIDKEEEKECNDIHLSALNTNWIQSVTEAYFITNITTYF